MTPPRSPNGHHTPYHQEDPPLESAETGHGDYEGVTMNQRTYRVGAGAEGAQYTVKQTSEGKWFWEFTEADDHGSALLDSSSADWLTPWEALRGVADDAYDSISRGCPAVRAARALASRLENRSRVEATHTP